MYVTLRKNPFIAPVYIIYIYIYIYTVHIAIYIQWLCILPVSTDNWSVFIQYFCQPPKFMTGEMVPLAMRTHIGDGNLIFLQMDDSRCLFSCCSGMLTHCGYLWTSYVYNHSKLFHSCHSASFLSLLPSPTPSQPFSPTPLLCCPTLMHSLKIIVKKWPKSAII